MLIYLSLNLIIIAIFKSYCYINCPFRGAAEIISNAQLSPDRHCNRRVRLPKARGAQARSCLSAAAAYVQSAKLTTS